MTENEEVEAARAVLVQIRDQAPIYESVADGNFTPAASILHNTIDAQLALLADRGLDQTFGKTRSPDPAVLTLARAINQESSYYGPAYEAVKAAEEQEIQELLRHTRRLIEDYPNTLSLHRQLASLLRESRQRRGPAINGGTK